jgi:hypothetical protein
MLIPFIIYIRAVGLYMLITLPILIAPFMYFFSVFYVLVYGWVAWGLFSLIYFLCRKIRNYEMKMGLLIWGVIPSVALAFHILGLCNPELDAWNSGGFLLFPVAGVFAGWISVFLARKTIRGRIEENEWIPGIPANEKNIPNQ